MIGGHYVARPDEVTIACSSSAQVSVVLAKWIPKRVTLTAFAGTSEVDRKACAVLAGALRAARVEVTVDAAWAAAMPGVAT